MLSLDYGALKLPLLNYTLIEVMAAIEFRVKKGTVYLFRMGRGDFSRPDFGRLKPPLPQTIAPKSCPIAFTKLNNSVPPGKGEKDLKRAAFMSYKKDQAYSHGKDKIHN